MNGSMPLLDLPFAHRLGWALLHSVWQGGVVAVCFALIRLGMRRRSANARYAMACVALVVLIGWPFVTLLRISTTSLSVSHSSKSSGPIVANEAAFFLAKVELLNPIRATPENLLHQTEWLDQLLPWTVVLWLAGVLGLSCRWLHGSRWIRQVKRIEIAALGPEWHMALRDLCRRFSISRPVRLLKSTLVDVPLVVGWLRPVILLPATALVGLSPEQLRAILAHELAHVRRHDFLINTFQNVVETLMFYHPAVWWISRCIREDREHCCDDLVVSICGDRLSYARALMTLEETRTFSRLAFAASDGSLFCRVRRLVAGAHEAGPPSPAEFSGMTLVAVGCILVFAAIWLFNAPARYQASALMKVSPVSHMRFGDAGPLVENYYPYFLQTECMVIRSPAVLELAARSLRTSTNRHPIDPEIKPAEGSSARLLRSHINLVPVPTTSVIEIQATDSDPAQAARFANAVADAYKQYRLERRRNDVHATLDQLERRFSDQLQQIRKAEQSLDKLRSELKLTDAVVSENAPTAALSAETLRRIESMRIEAQSEYVKQKTLLEQLGKVDSGDLPATILTVGVQDNQLATLSESLSLVEQRLVSLQKELGPEHTEVVKAAAQQEDLRRKIKARTTGILLGLQAKCESTAQGLLALSNAVVNAETTDRETASRSRPYFEAKRELEELQRFNSVLGSKIALERTDLQVGEAGVETIEEAIAPTKGVNPNRPRAIALLGTGLALALGGWLLARAGRHSIMIPKPA